MISSLPAESTEQLDELLRSHVDAMYRVAYSVVRDRALAEDVTQDAILQAWRSLDTFRGDSTMRSWLLRIAHNTAVSTLRRRREEVRDPAEMPEGQHRINLEGSVVETLSIDAFGRALAELDDMSRSVIVLREVDGLSYEEISCELDVPMSTVKTRLLRARRSLAVALREWKP